LLLEWAGYDAEDPPTTGILLGSTKLITVRMRSWTP